MPEKGINFSNLKILWDIEINGKVRHNRPSTTIKEKNTRNGNECMSWYPSITMLL